MAARQLRRLRGPRPAGRGPWHPGHAEEPRMTDLAAGPVSAADPTLASFYPLVWWIIAIKVVVIFLFLLLFQIFMIWAERRGVGRLQAPPGAHPGGGVRAGSAGRRRAQAAAEGRHRAAAGGQVPVRPGPDPGRGARVYQLRDHPGRPHSVDLRG